MKSKNKSVYVKNCCSCGTEDCPVDCENQYKCVDKSELCDQLKPHCENFFLRKCMRCACPKTCGVCGQHSKGAGEPASTAASTSAMSTLTSTFMTPIDTSSSIYITPEFDFPTENASAPFLLDITNSTLLTTIQTTEVFNATIEVISDEEFKNPAKMKCKSCDAKRKKLAEIYEKYYPKE
uniref:ShKT domain-containing protein n=1 Tax=Globodera rostochiensis TaxID=31243 RepID=A0A914GS25_GLORO